MRIIDDIQSRGGTVTSFSSVCGGLPAPEATDNPLRYKFSWSPQGVIAASQSPARYRWEDHVVNVSEELCCFEPVSYRNLMHSFDLDSRARALAECSSFYGRMARTPLGMPTQSRLSSL